MAAEIVVPEVGESVNEVTVARWLKQVGDRVESGEPVVELETDKVDLEVGAERSGTLEEIRVEEGEDVEVGGVLGLIAPGEPDEDAGDEPDDDGAAEEEPEAGSDDGEEEEEAPEKKKEKENTEEGEKEADEAEDDARATPLAREMARQHDIDLDEVEGSGKKGRVTRDDVAAHVGEDDTETDDADGDADADGKEDSDEEPARRAPARPEDAVRLSRRRRTIAKRLAEGQRETAAVTTFNDVEMTSVLDVRRRHRDDFEGRYGVKLGITSFFVKASIAALKDFPVLNAELGDGQMVLKHYYDVGIAVATDKGLVVPVLRDADAMSLAEIEIAVARFARQARENRLALEDLRGGTFTITNGGIFGSLLSTPLLNPPQVGILGLHRIEERCVVRDGQPAVRPMMYVALTYDHRLVDGREAVRFLGRLKELVEDAETLFLES